MDTYQQLIEAAYRAFNSRDIDGALALMQPDVEWPNGMEGGYVYGHEGVRAYWSRQWTLIDPHVEPVAFSTDEHARIRTEVRQVISDMKGVVIKTDTVYHLYQIEDGLIGRMDIELSE